MPFVPRLPTWNTDVECYLYNPATGLAEFSQTITGQIYVAQRAQPGTTFGDLYLMYPKADDLLRDVTAFGLRPWNFEVTPCDVVVFDHPSGTGGPHYYGVVQVFPRWLNFPNEHRMARLRELTEDERTQLLITGDPVDPDQSTISCDPDSVPADGVSVSTVTVTVKKASGAPAPGVSVSLSNTGSATTLPPTAITDVSGVAEFAAADETAETVTFTASISGGGSVGPSENVVFTTVPPDGDFELDVTGVSDGSCDECGSLNTTVSLPNTSPGTYVSGPVTTPCVADTSNWVLALVMGDTATLTLNEQLNPTPLVVYEADISTWNESDPITLDFVNDDGFPGLCAWPATLTVTLV